MAPRLAYISFDTVPAPKGAAVHIQALVQAIAVAFGEVHLVTVSPNGETRTHHHRWPGVHHTILPAEGPTLIDRVLAFRHHLLHWWQGKHFDIVHFRSIYEGFPLALQKAELTRHLLFEVNGLPSIELKYRYPRVAGDRDLLEKLRRQEALCLEAADRIITPSPTTQTYLSRRGTPTDKIQVIPNGVDLGLFQYFPPQMGRDLSPLRLLYFGTAAAWQGVAIALQALALYQRDYPAELTILSPLRPSQRRELHYLIRKLDLGETVHLREPLSQAGLVPQMHQSDVILAPLTLNDRNLVQGCCPLKVLEGMASGTPVLTSDLPVIRDLGTPEEHFLAVRPGSAKAIKDALLRLREEPSLRERLAIAARQRIEAHYTWDHTTKPLVALYQDLLLQPSQEETLQPLDQKLNNL